MRTEYIFTEDEIRKAKSRATELKQLALMCRDEGDTESNREIYLRAKGFCEALEILGIYPKHNKRD